MKVFVTSFLLSLVLLCSLASCKSDSRNQVEHRNQNFIWFVPEGKSLGRWIEIDYSGNSEVLASGNCTEFYYNGNKRIKYDLDEKGNRDTTFYFNLNGIITHYSTENNGEIKNHFYIDGDFESYLWDGSKAISGVVQKNQLTNFQWEGKMADFYKLVSSQTKVWRGFEGFLKNISETFKRNYQSGAKKIPPRECYRLDSIRLSLMESTEILLEELIYIKVDPQCFILKESSITFIQSTQSLLENDSQNLLQILSLEFSEERVNNMAKITQKMIEESKMTDSKDEEIYTEWSRYYKPGDYLVPYLRKLDRR